MDNLKNEEKSNSNSVTNFINEEAWNVLGEEDGGGSYCCGKRMVLASSGIVYECLKCGGWEYSSS